MEKIQRKMFLLLAASLSFCIVSFAQTAGAPNEFKEQNSLFTIDMPDGWSGQEKAEHVYLLPPPPNGNAIVMHFKDDAGSETPEESNVRLNSSIEYMIENKIKPNDGTVIDNKEITIDGINAKRLFYTVFLNQESIYFVHIVFVNKGLTYTIDYGAPSQETVAKSDDVVETLKF